MASRPTDDEARRFLARAQRDGYLEPIVRIIEEHAATLAGRLRAELAHPLMLASRKRERWFVARQGALAELDRVVRSLRALSVPEVERESTSPRARAAE